MKRAFHSFPDPSFFPNRFIFLPVRLRGREEKRDRDKGTRRRKSDTREGADSCPRTEEPERGSFALLKNRQGEHTDPAAFSEGRNAQKSAPLSGDRGAHKAFGLVRNAGQEASRDLCPLTEKSLFPPLPESFGNRPGTSPRPGARKNTSGLSFPHPDGTRPGSTVPACAAARHLPERTRRTTTDDVRHVRTRLNAGRPNAAVCLYRHAHRPIFFPAARKARADTAPR